MKVNEDGTMGFGKADDSFDNTPPDDIDKLRVARDEAEKAYKVWAASPVGVLPWNQLSPAQQTEGESLWATFSNLRDAVNARRGPDPLALAGAPVEDVDPIADYSRVEYPVETFVAPGTEMPKAPAPLPPMPPELAPLLAFREAWMKLPPLVRAGQAASIAHLLALDAKATVDHEHNDTVLGMPRRARVSHSFERALYAAVNLFVALANEADNEAEASGLGPLIEKT